jgi:hypothetical protein
VEAALLLDEAPPPVRPLDDGATCPWQDEAGRCTARQVRPSGCRVFFCDSAYREAMPIIAERHLERLKALVRRRGLPWDYAPLHHHLRNPRRASLADATAQRIDTDDMSPCPEP